MAEQLKFYFDTHIAKAIAVQLRSRGVDVVRCEEVGMANASDEAHLEYAASQERVMVSGDHDFEELNASWINAGKKHFGIFRVSPKFKGSGSIGVLVKEIMLYYEAVMGETATIEADFINQIIHIK